jgi:hypothetical protein
VHEVHFQHGRAYEAVLALEVADRALRAGAAKTRVDAREELTRLQLALEGWEHPENVSDGGVAAQSALAGSRQTGTKKRAEAKARRTPPGKGR